MQRRPDAILPLKWRVLTREVNDMVEHFSADDIAAWEGTVQGNPEALDEPPAEAELPPDVPEDLADKAAEWAGTVQGNADAELTDGDSTES
jgi:hypothetical protein